MKAMRIILVMLLGLTSHVSANAEGMTGKSYAIPGHGSLQLQVPDGWSDDVRQNAENFPPTIVFSGVEDSPFLVKITPMWALPGVKGDITSPKVIHDLVSNAARAAESQALEGHPEIMKVGSGQGGYYFHATDKAPQPGEFKYMAQGAVQVGELLCTFTVLTDSAKPMVTNQALNMLSHALLRPNE